MQKTFPRRKSATGLGRQIKAITFDFWGTLVGEQTRAVQGRSFHDLKLEFFRDTLQARGINITREQTSAAYRHASEMFDVLWRRAEAFDATYGISEMLSFLELEDQVPEDVRRELVLFFEEIVNRTTLSLIPGTAEAIERAAGSYRLGVISDTAWTPGRVLREQLRRNGVADHFDSWVFSGEVGCSKPHKTMFARATSELGVSPEECLHIGDLQFTDIKGAKAFGCHAAWISRPDYLWNKRKSYNPDLVVDNVAECVSRLLDDA